MCPRKHILGQKGCFWAKHPNYFGREQKFWCPYIKKPLSNLVRNIFLVGHCTKWTRKASIWPKMTTNSYFGPNLAFFGPKILNFYGRKQKFWYIGKNLGTSFALFFDRAWDQMGQKCQFWAKNPNFYGIKSFWDPHNRKPLRHLVRIVYDPQ